MFDILLIVLFSLFWLITLISILRKSLFVGIFYFFLYLYCIFAMIGYCFFPQLSEILLQAYFGKVVFYKFYVFNFFSFIAFYVFFIFLYRKFRAARPYPVTRVTSSTLPLVGLVIIHIYLLAFLFLFIKFYGLLNYANFANEELSSSLGVSFSLFIVLFKLLTLISSLFYCLLRVKIKDTGISKLSSGVLLYLFIVTFTCLLVTSLKIGSRTDLLALVIAVTVFEIQMGITRSKIYKAIIVGGLAACLFIYLERTRTESQDLGFSTAEKIIAQDYYSPAHILFAAIEYNYVHPGIVLSSNVANSLIKLKYPYLQAFVMELFMPGRASRSSSIAFYVFSEGFMVLGYLGFIYNGIVLNLFLFLWKRIAQSSKKQVNYIFIAIFATQLANMARSQTSYFIKDIYIVFLPVFILFFCFTGYFFKISKPK